MCRRLSWDVGAACCCEFLSVSIKFNEPLRVLNILHQPFRHMLKSTCRMGNDYDALAAAATAAATAEGQNCSDARLSSALCVCDLPFAVRLGGWAQVSW